MNGANVEAIIVNIRSSELAVFLAAKSAPSRMFYFACFLVGDDC